jgi:mannose/fructose/N-acetylgalactosamine-specific phosphotransferase system component IIC
MSAAELVGLAALGAVLALDRSAWPSLLLAQPAVAGALAGAVLGRFDAGVAVGAILQLVWFVEFPVGGAVLAESWLAAVAATAAAPPAIECRDAAWLADPLLAGPTLVGALAAAAGRWALLGQRALQGRLAAGRSTRQAGGEAGIAARLHGLALALHALRGALAALAAAILAPPLARVLAAGGVAAPAGYLALALALAAFVRSEAGRRRMLLIGVLLGAAIAWMS